MTELRLLFVSDTVTVLLEVKYRQVTPELVTIGCLLAKISTSGTATYQLAFFTPGIRPCDAISRNWIRDNPNWRM